MPAPSGSVYITGATILVLLAVSLRALIVRTEAGRRFIDTLHTIESFLVASLLLAMIVLSFLQIVLRNVAGTGFLWVDPLLRHLLLWLGFGGAALAARLDRHMNVEAVSRLVHGRLLRALRLVTLLAAAVVCLIVSSACVTAVREEAAAGTTTFLAIPIWQLQTVMPAGFLFMAYRFARRAFAADPGRLAITHTDDVAEVVP